MNQAATAASVPQAAETPARMPPQIPYIVGNEGCERFSFYGMRNILTPFLVSSLLLYLPESERGGMAKDVFHTFVIGVYFFPLLGGWLSDRFLGKFRTIFYGSLIYCAGHLCLAMFEKNRMGFYAGLGLIAFASGAIKPCVSSFVGDQFDQSNKHLAKVAFDIFYWMINIGSFFASLLMPVFLDKYGGSVAFGIPGALMFIATFILWLGRKKYVMVAPEPRHPDSFMNVIRTALTAPGPHHHGRNLAIAGAVLAVASLGLIPILHFVPSFCIGLLVLIAFTSLGTWIQLERARGTHSDEAVQGVRVVLKVMIIFALVTPFYSLFDQKASTWVLQAKDMTKPDWFRPAQMQAINPALVMIIIPFNNLVLHPLLRRLGWEPTALRRMTVGLVFTGVSWIVVGSMQLVIDSGTPFSIAWQVLPYALLTFGEVWVSATGLEFAYSQAPGSMKGALMSLWYLANTFGNLWVLLVNAGVRNDGVIAAIKNTGIGVTAFQMYFFAAFALVVAVVFGLYVRRYQPVDGYRKAV